LSECARATYERRRREREGGDGEGTGGGSCGKPSEAGKKYGPTLSGRRSAGERVAQLTNPIRHCGARGGKQAQGGEGTRRIPVPRRARAVSRTRSALLCRAMARGARQEERPRGPSRARSGLRFRAKCGGGGRGGGGEEAEEEREASCCVERSHSGRAEPRPRAEGDASGVPHAAPAPASLPRRQAGRAMPQAAASSVCPLGSSPAPPAALSEPRRPLPQREPGHSTHTRGTQPERLAAAGPTPTPGKERAPAS